ncbi:MAG TPA: ABC transporter substrate-binding protein [Candidatus Methanofastidiosum sp.]|nr:ABC transporter substrate-binding protein [Methanofastidiosum sp.]
MAELPMYIAYDQGYFEEEGLNITLVPSGYKEEMDALIRGDIDIIPATSLTLPFGIELQSPGQIKIFHLGGINDNDDEIVEGILVHKNSNIKTITDLIGKNIGVPEGSVDYFVIKTVLEKIGLSPKENNISIKQMGKELLPQAFISNNVDAIYLTQPQLTSVQRQTNSKFLIVNPRPKYVLNPFWSGGGVVTTKFLTNENNQILFDKYLRAFDKAIDYMRENPIEAKNLLVKYADIDSDLTDEMGNYFKTKSNEDVDLESLQKIANIYKDVGILTNNIDVSNLLLIQE